MFQTIQLKIAAIVAVMLIPLSSGVTYQITKTFQQNKHNSEVATLQQHIHDVELELEEKKGILSALEAESDKIKWQAEINKKKIASLNQALSRKQKDVLAIKASDCSSALREVLNNAK